MEQVEKVLQTGRKILPKEWDYTEIKVYFLEAQQSSTKFALTPSAKPAVFWRIPGGCVCTVDSTRTIQ